MTLNAERVTFTKKKKTVACPVPLAPLADTHAHLLSFWGKEVPETLVRAKAAGVDLLVTMLDPIADKRSVTDYSDWLVREILPMRDIPQIKYLAGVHPYGAPDYTDDIHAQVVAALDDPLCVASARSVWTITWITTTTSRRRPTVCRLIAWYVSSKLPCAAMCRWSCTCGTRTRMGSALRTLMRTTCCAR